MVRISDILKRRAEGGDAPEPEKSGAKKPVEAAPQETPDVAPAISGEPQQERPVSPVPIVPPASSLPLPPDVVMPLPVTPSEENTKIDSQPPAPPVSAMNISGQAPLGMQIAKVMKEIEPDAQRSKDLYAQGLELAKGMFAAIESKKQIELKAIKDLVEGITNCFILGDKTFITIFYHDYDVGEYLYHHILNTMVMSIAVGVKLGFNKIPLNELGLTAFLHDVGMAKFKDIAIKPGVLTPEELSCIKEHPEYSRVILSEVKDIPSSVISAVEQVHERINGQGYPRGLQGGQICEYAKIVATIDVYEALTHARSYRKKFAPYEAIKEMNTVGNARFDAYIFKVLIDVVGVYPVGSYAQLNSDEIVKIVTSNDDFPLRPVVNVIFDVGRNRLEQPRLVNLAKQFNLYIKKPLSDIDVERLIQK